MKEVTPFIWSIWLGEMPMPDGATHEMMDAAIGAMNELERKEEAAEGIMYHSKSLEHYENRLQEVQSKGEDTKTLESIVKTTKEIIETYQGWLL